MKDIDFMKLVNHSGIKVTNCSNLTAFYYYKDNEMMGLRFVTPQTNFRLWLDLHLPIEEIKQLNTTTEAFQYLEQKIKTFANVNVKITQG